MAIFRILLATLLSTLPSLNAQAEQILSKSEGNFEVQGIVRSVSDRTTMLRFRAKAGLGYRILLAGPAIGQLDDPGRRQGILAPSTLSDSKETAFRLIANGSRIQLEVNGKPVWDYTEKAAGVASAGAVVLQGDAREVGDLQFRALPPTPPSFAERYGPGLGEPAPPIDAIDQSGKPRDFSSLRGPKGLWILFIRSADW